MGPGWEIATAGPKVFMPGQDPSFQEEWGGGVDPQVGSVDFFPSQLTLPCTTSWQAGNPNWLLHFWQIPVSSLSPLIGYGLGCFDLKVLKVLVWATQNQFFETISWSDLLHSVLANNPAFMHQLLHCASEAAPLFLWPVWVVGVTRQKAIQVIWRAVGFIWARHFSTWTDCCIHSTFLYC